jgi:hypothetical protein
LPEKIPSTVRIDALELFHKFLIAQLTIAVSIANVELATAVAKLTCQSNPQ